MTDTTTEGTEITLEAPAVLTFSEEGAEEERRTERVARLLEAGDYPDKGLHLTEDDLDAIVARFSEGVPVKVEHVDSPLDPLGHVKRVWREGSALLGTLAFPDDLAAFLRRRGAAKLSVGLQRDPLLLREVSLVLKPRIVGAVLMGVSAPAPRPALDPAPLLRGAASGRGESEGASEVARLRAELTRRDVETQIAAFKAQGRLVPASEPAARALLAAGVEAVVTLSEGGGEGGEPVALVFRRFLEAQPPVVSFGEAAGGDWRAAHGFTHDEHMFLSKRLGVDPARVAALLREEQARTQKDESGGNGNAL